MDSGIRNLSCLNSPYNTGEKFAHFAAWIICILERTANHATNKGGYISWYNFCMTHSGFKDMSLIINSHNLGRNRDPSIDVLKGIAIIFVVYGHTWPFCRDFIYLFHMAVFMMASGYCYKTDINSVREWGCYIVRKVKSLYIPFVICNGCIVLLESLFFKIGFYTDNTTFIATTQNWPVIQTVYTSTGLVGIAKAILKVILFIGPTQLGTATWFLTSLFIILVVHSGVVFVISGLSKKEREIVILCIFIVMSFISQLISLNRPDMLYAIKVFPCTYVAFLLGILTKKIRWRYLYSLWMSFFSLVFLIVISQFYTIEVSAARIGNVAIYLVVAMAGWILLKFLSEQLCRSIVLTKFFSYIGEHTMVILCLHVISFKLMSLIFIYTYHLPFYYLASWHVIFDANEFWKLLYLFVGVAIPLMFYWIYKRMRNSLFISFRKSI